MSEALSASKARLILHHGYVHDRSGRVHRLSSAQRRYLGAIASGYAPWSPAQRRRHMKATVRYENPGLGHAIWAGAKSGYHTYRAGRYEAKAKKHRALAMRNPKVVGRIPGHALEIRYQRTGRSLPGRYKHPFEHPVKMYAMNDGSVLLRGTKKIHADDRERDFDQYVHPSHRRRNPMARRSGGGNTGMWLLVGLGAFLLMRPGGLTNIFGGAQQYGPATVWVDTTDGTMVVGPSQPGPNWRLATQAEIQMAVIPMA